MRKAHVFTNIEEFNANFTTDGKIGGEIARTYGPVDARRKENVRRCGSSMWRLNPATAEVCSYISECKNWRDCSRCRRKRLEKFEKRYEQCLEDTHGQLGITIQSDERSPLITRKLRRDGSECWRVPTEIGIVIFFDMRKTDLPSTDELPSFKTLIETPFFKRHTGKLGRELKNDYGDKGEVLKVNLTRIGDITDITLSALTVAAQLANEMVDHLPEFTVQDIEWTCNETMDRFAHNIRKLGGKVGYIKKTKISVSYSYYRYLGGRSNMTTEDSFSDAVAAFNTETVPVQHTIDELFAP